jgi:hypothetical protein
MPTRSVWFGAAVVAGALGVAACGRDNVVAPTPVAPEITANAVTANANNVLSAIVTARVRFADSAAVFYRSASNADTGTTAAVPVDGDSALIPVLGLLPATAYTVRVVVYGRGAPASGEPLAFTTDPLPNDLPQFVASGSDPSPGYVAFGAGRYGLVIDNTGRVVWYRRFENGPGLNFEVEPTGHYFARPTTPDPNDLDPWVELDPLGDVVRTFGCAAHLEPRFHDLIAEPDGTYWIMCDEVRTLDLSSLGGKQNAQVMGTVVQHVTASGDALFQWSPFDHFDIADLDQSSRIGTNVNWTHGNALDLDTDGNLIVSFRNLNEITKIDTRTGAVLWRMGGARNQFAFQDVSSPAFSFQHALRVTAPGHLLLLDNLGDPRCSSAERYVYDATLHTARMLGSYLPNPAAVSQTGGSAQDLPGGRTLVSFGPAGRVEEYDASGRVTWRIEGNPGYVFRAQRIGSLYRPGAGGRR